MKFTSIAFAAVVACCAAATVQGAIQYSNGFETDTVDWSPGVARVPSGTGGVTSADGAYHATTGADFTRWGGYNFGAGNAVPTAFKEYWTSIDIYLNVGGGFANNTRFDFSSAINNAAGTFLRDFIFNAGFYNAADLDAPGGGADRFIVSASNNSQPGSAYAKNPGRDPIAISTTGWYTFEHHFYDNAGQLAVDMTIYDASNSAVHTWTLSDVTDLIAGVGGNRYGWFDYNQFAALPIDNAVLRTADGAVPEAHTIAVWSVLGGCGLIGAWWSRRGANT